MPLSANINPDFTPGYLKLHKTGELKKRGQQLWKMMESCSMCPRLCAAQRLDGEEGFCGASSQLEVSSHYAHFGEEEALVGSSGSGTIFFSNCNLRCIFCINSEVSQENQSSPCSIDELADMMLALQQQGCHNINVVTPTQYVPHIILALDKAVEKGLRLPFVYNTCGWEREEILHKLDGIVDIYLPDFKYLSGDMASKYSSDAHTYPEVVQKALVEMHRQVGVAKTSEDGLMHRGLMIRHLVMPSNVSGTKEIIEWISENLPKDTYLNLMSQYVPMYKACEHPEISRKITTKEYDDAVQCARKAGLTNIDVQGYPFSGLI